MEGRKQRQDADGEGGDEDATSWGRAVKRIRRGEFEVETGVGAAEGGGDGAGEEHVGGENTLAADVELFGGHGGVDRAWNICQCWLG